VVPVGLCICRRWEESGRSNCNHPHGQLCHTAEMVKRSHGSHLHLIDIQSSVYEQETLYKFRLANRLYEI
jgi:hypothetical protein